MGSGPGPDAHSARGRPADLVAVLDPAGPGPLCPRRHDYSVAPAVIGHQVTALTCGEQVVLLASGGKIVVRHARCWARHQTLTDPEHAEAGQAMRQEVRRRSTGQIHAVGSVCGPLVEVEQRELGSNDRPSSTAAKTRRPVDAPLLHHRR
ncbi:Mu transposase domain-containing protein [Streptomyces gelaticus]